MHSSSFIISHQRQESFSPVQSWTGFNEISIFPPLQWRFSHSCQFSEVSIFFTNKHTFSSIIFHNENPCSWNLTCTGFDIQYLIPNLLIASFLRSLSSTFVLWKKEGHAVASSSEFYLSRIFAHSALKSTEEPAFTKFSEPWVCG
jgi:hypothetical protein